MVIKEFLVQPVVRTVAIRTAKNIVVLGATATIAFFSNSIFKSQANNILKSAMTDFSIIRNLVRA